MKEPATVEPSASAPLQDDQRATGRIIRKNLSMVGLTYFVAGAVGFAAQAILARRVGRGAFGLYIAALSLVAILKVLYQLARDEYIVREGARDRSRLESLIGNILVLKVATGLLVVGMSVVAAVLLGFEKTGVAVTALLALMAGADAVTDAFRGGLQALERMELVSAISIGVAVFSAAGMAAVVLAGGDLVEAVAASAAVSFLSIPVAWLALTRRAAVRFGGSVRAVLRVARESFPFTAAGVLTVATGYVDTLVVRGVLGPRATALYGAAYRIITVLGWVPTVFQISVYRSMSYLAHRARDEFGPFVERSAAAVCLLALPVPVGGMLVGRKVLPLVFGRHFAPGADAFQALLWSLPLAFPAVLLMTAVIVDKRPQAAGWIFGAAFAGNLTANLVFVPRFGIEAAAWITVITEAFVALAATTVLARRGVRPGWPVLALPGVPAAALMGLAILPLRHLPLLVPLAVGGGVYTAALLVARVPARLGLRRPPDAAGPGSGWGPTTPPTTPQPDAPRPALGHTSPRVSAVMPVHNVQLFVEDSIRSVLAQTFRDFELIVVDDGSTDDTPAIVRSFHDPRIRIIRQPHLGLTAAENAGLAAASGEFTARVDGDDLYLPELFAKQVAVLEEHPRTAGVAVWARRFGRAQWLDRPPAHPTSIKRRLRRTWVLSQPMMYRTDAVRDAGGFRPVESEDWDLWIRLAARHELRSVPEYLALIRERPGSMTASLSSMGDRLDVLKMRLFAVRRLGPDVLSSIAIGKSLLRVSIGWIRLRTGTLLPSGRPLPMPSEVPPAIGVVVPTYGRPELLARCLRALGEQVPPPQEVVVVYRPEDAATLPILEAWTAEDRDRHRVVPVDRPGLVHALIAGTEAARSEVVAYLDDDATPRPGWIAELGRLFVDPTVGAAGGRLIDHVDGRAVEERTRRVGVVTWYGRIIWGHNRESSRYGEVDWLTGSNVAIRRHIASHDTRLLHQSGGLAMANDLDTSLAVKRAGYRVLYSPWAAVEHHTTSFRDPELGSRVAGEDVVSSVANHTYALLKGRSPWGRAALFIYGYLVGSASMAGPARAAAELPRSPRRARAMAHRLPLVWRGRRLGARMHRAWKRERWSRTEPPERATPQAVVGGRSGRPG